MSCNECNQQIKAMSKSKVLSTNRSSKVANRKTIRSDWFACFISKNGGCQQLNHPNSANYVLFWNQFKKKVRIWGCKKKESPRYPVAPGSMRSMKKTKEMKKKPGQLRLSNKTRRNKSRRRNKKESGPRESNRPLGKRASMAAAATAVFFFVAHFSHVI